MLWRGAKLLLRKYWFFFCGQGIKILDEFHMVMMWVRVWVTCLPSGRQREFSTRGRVWVYGDRGREPITHGQFFSSFFKGLNPRPVQSNQPPKSQSHYCQSLSLIVSSLLRVAVALSFGLQWRHRSLIKSTSKKSRRLAVISVLWYTAEAVLPSCFA